MPKLVIPLKGVVARPPSHKLLRASCLTFHIHGEECTMLVAVSSILETRVDFRSSVYAAHAYPQLSSILISE